MYNHNKAQQSKNRVHISWDILCLVSIIALAIPIIYRSTHIKQVKFYADVIAVLVDTLKQYEGRCLIRDYI